MLQTKETDRSAGSFPRSSTHREPVDRQGPVIRPMGRSSKMWFIFLPVGRRLALIEVIFSVSRNSDSCCEEQNKQGFEELHFKLREENGGVEVNQRGIDLSA